MSELRLRIATEDDVDLLFEWVNEDSVRKNSFNSNPISYAEHVEWFKNLLDNSNTKQYICDGIAVGYIRVLARSENAAISYSVGHIYRCMGYGKAILSLARSAVKRDFPTVRYLIGEVKLDNIASQKTFIDAGFEKKSINYIGEVLNGSDVVVVEDTNTAKRDKRVLFLTNNANTLSLYTWISERADCYLYSEPIDLSQVLILHPDILVSYNYKYIISSDVIDEMDGNAFNLHISYLPWNRGSSPNFWSFIDNSPKGVSIHKIAEKLDRGDIIFQKELYFDEKTETFASSYETLHKEIMELFRNNWEAISSGNLSPIMQSERGSYHNNADLEEFCKKVDFSWDDTIESVKNRLARFI